MLVSALSCRLWLFQQRQLRNLDYRLAIKNPILDHLVAPLCPPGELIPGEQLQIRPRAALHDYLIKLIRFPRMFPLLCCNQIDLSSPGGSGAQVSSDSEEHQFCHIAEVEADASSIWPLIFSNFVPDKVSFVGKSPSLHHFQPFG